MPELDDGLASARELVDGARSVVVLTGAGISTDSGIPDFRGPQGVWTRDPMAEKLSNIEFYVADAEVRREAWRRRLDSTAWTAQPNDGHRAIVALERRGVLGALITQNIDGLHQRAGSDPSLVIEVHGTLREVECLGCGWRDDMEPTLDRVRSGEEDPACLTCGGILKSATISFGQPLVAEDLDRAFEAASRCDVLIAVGTTLTVHPIADAVPVAHRAGAAVVIVNAEPTAMDHLANVILRDRIAAVLPALLE